MPKAIRRLQPDVQHFFDTNFFLIALSDLPALNNVPKSRRWVTETVEGEVRDKLDETAAAAALQGYKVLRFNDLYAADPNVCPTFYTFVEAMFSAANIGTEEFYEELLLSKRIAGVSDEGDARLYAELRRRSQRGRDTNPDGTPKSARLRRLEQYDSATRKKIVAAIRDGHPSIIRDIKTMALALYYCLKTRQNVILYSTDADPVSLLFRWINSVTMRSILVFETLSRLGATGREQAIRRPTRLVIPYDVFVSKEREFYKGMVYDWYKTSGCRFTVRRWDQNLRVFEEVYFTFEKSVADGIARMHGNRWCHFTKNDELGNWLHLRYVWPPVDPLSNDLYVNVRRKPICHTSMKVSTDEHDRECLYRRTDADGRLQEWSQFEW